jgi:DivIVA domain-containing protein
MVWILFALVAVLVVLVLAAVGTAPHHGLPDTDWRADDIDQVRFDTALRGYRMDQVDDVLDHLQRRVAELEERADRPVERRDDGTGLV